MCPPGLGVNTPDAGVNRINSHVGGQLLDANLNVRLQRLYCCIDGLLNFAINFLHED